MVLKHAGGLQPLFNLKTFNHYMHMPTLKMSTIRQVWQLNQQGDYALCTDLKDASLHIVIVKHHHHIYINCLETQTLSQKALQFGLTTTPSIFTLLYKLIFFFCQCKGFHIIFTYFDDILVLIHSKPGARHHNIFVLIIGSSWAMH